METRAVGRAAPPIAPKQPREKRFQVARTVQDAHDLDAPVTRDVENEVLAQALDEMKAHTRQRSIVVVAASTHARRQQQSLLGRSHCIDEPVGRRHVVLADVGGSGLDVAIRGRTPDNAPTSHRLRLDFAMRA